MMLIYEIGTKPLEVKKEKNHSFFVPTNWERKSQKNLLSKRFVENSSVIFPFDQFLTFSFCVTSLGNYIESTSVICSEERS